MIKKIGYFLANFIWAFEISEMPAISQHNKTRPRYGLSDVGDTFDGDKNHNLRK